MEGAPSPIADLQPEILVEIFHKLPLTVLGRCLRVCKQWRCLISDPLFRSNYNPNSIRNHPISLLVQIDDEGFKYITDGASGNCRVGRPYPFGDGSFFGDDSFATGWCFVLGSCNGLVALYKCSGQFILFNPCTKEERCIRFYDEYDQVALTIKWMGLRLYGLCYDPASDDYKAVMSIMSSFFVVSLRHGSIKSAPDRSQLLKKLSRWTGGGTVVGGVPHWPCTLRHVHRVIIYFDLLTDDVKMVPFPERNGGDWMEDGLGALDGQLTATFQGKTSGFEVWALNKYGDKPSWSMLFVTPNDIVCPPRRILSRMTDDEILIDEERLVIYNIRNRSSRDLLLWNGRHKTVAYIPSLVSPNPIDDDGRQFFIC